MKIIKIYFLSFILSLFISCLFGFLICKLIYKPILFESFTISEINNNSFSQKGSMELTLNGDGVFIKDTSKNKAKVILLPEKSLINIRYSN